MTVEEQVKYITDVIEFQQRRIDMLSRHEDKILNMLEEITRDIAEIKIDILNLKERINNNDNTR